MTGFNVRDFIARIDQEHETRVGRALLSLMRDFKSPEPFELHLAPHAFGIEPPQLMATVERLMKKMHLDHSASVTFDSQEKVAVVIKASDLRTSTVQTNIATMLGQIHQHAEQLGI